MERLYYTDPYLMVFDAKITHMDERGGRYFARLDQSAFYPTSGGQPFDAGAIGNADVLDVFIEDGQVVHEVSAPLTPGQVVSCGIDWSRRFDHMQQHAGEHMLAYEIWKKAGGTTIGLHLGAEVSTIDVEMPGGETRIGDDLIAEIEDAVNRKIQSDLPIRCWFPEREALLSLPLRKPPTVEENVRIVAIGEEMVACGGTHPSTTGQIGLLKILDVRPSKGKMRVTFVCGMRAISDYRARFSATESAAALLSTKVESLPCAAEQLLARIRAMETEIGRLKKEAVYAKIPDLISGAAVLSGGYPLVATEIDGLDMQNLRDLAKELTGAHHAVALLVSGHETGVYLLFACPKEFPVHMGKLLSESARAYGGKGGGQPDFAQGGAPTAQPLMTAKEKLLDDAMWVL